MPRRVEGQSGNLQHPANCVKRAACDFVARHAVIDFKQSGIAGAETYTDGLGGDLQYNSLAQLRLVCFEESDGRIVCSFDPLKRSTQFEFATPLDLIEAQSNGYRRSRWNTIEVSRDGECV